MSFFPTIVDVSKWQGNINWDTAKNYIHFAIIRGQDGSMLDSKLSRNIQACERLSIPYFVYGFYRGNGAAEAKQLVSRVKAAGGSHVRGYVLDVELSGYSKSGITQFFANVPSGLKNGLYLAHNLYSEYYRDNYGHDWLWIPRYGANTGKPSARPAYSCDLWQFTSKGSVPGISGNVDCNACMNKDLEYFTGGTVASGGSSGGGIDLGDTAWTGPKMIEEWQRQRGTDPDGFLSGQTVYNRDNVLERVERGCIEIGPANGGGSALVISVQNLIGVDPDGHMGHDTVLGLQGWLADRGYYSDDLDGNYGPNTSRGVGAALLDKAFQK